MGKTSTWSNKCTSTWKHPHVRGEDHTLWRRRVDQKETPPRAWGRLTPSTYEKLRFGNTPTCVGKTSAKLLAALRPGKHPHVRGEDRLVASALDAAAETPPRAWGRLGCANGLLESSRNTPTCVGKTKSTDSVQLSPKKHPHVRGEDFGGPGPVLRGRETPPRAWGRRIGGFRGRPFDGNTPTCVGKTAPHHLHHAPGGKHPHVRGEDRPALPSAMPGQETPPRAWGRHDRLVKCVLSPRNTPTCVGKTGLREAVRVEETETPPRAWGRQSLAAPRHANSRNTPTCVGKT